MMKPTERAALIVTYHADAKIGLTAEALLPAAARAADTPGVELAYLRRHWKRGPHVKLVLRGDESSCRSALHEAHRDIEDYLRGPAASGASLDVEAYLRASERLGRAELDPGPYGPIRPDNTVEPATVDIADGLLELTAAPAREELLHAARPALAATLAHAGTGDAARSRLLESAYRVLVLLASSYPRGLRQGYMSFLSHVQEFLLWNDRNGTIADGFATGLARQRDRLRAATEEIAEAHVLDPRQPSRYTGTDPLLRIWAGFFADGWAKGLALAGAGHLHPYPDPRRVVRAEEFGPDAVRQWAGRDDRPYSQFHVKLRQLNLPAVGMGDQFAAYRLLCNVVYELLPLLDVSPVERYFLGYCLAEIAQDIVGERWAQTLDRVVAAQAAAGLLPDGGHR